MWLLMCGCDVNGRVRVPCPTIMIPSDPSEELHPNLCSYRRAVLRSKHLSNRARCRGRHACLKICVPSHHFCRNTSLGVIGKSNDKKKSMCCIVHFQFTLLSLGVGMIGYKLSLSWTVITSSRLVGSSTSQLSSWPYHIISPLQHYAWRSVHKNKTTTTRHSQHLRHPNTLRFSLFLDVYAGYLELGLGNVGYFITEGL